VATAPLGGSCVSSSCQAPAQCDPNLLICIDC
jgi:hypothetical protein